LVQRSLVVLGPSALGWEQVDRRSNSHGDSFSNMKFLIANEQVDSSIADACELAAQPAVGDVVVYRRR
jgi:hypothetical protein